MLVCKINPKLPQKEIINKAVNLLKAGGIVVYPTETVYGLAADFLNPEAVKKIFKIKKRPSNKKVTLIAADFEIVKRYFYLNELEKKLAKIYWPGPLTIILRAKEKKSGGLGVRVSSSKTAQGLSQKLGSLITATSANVSGKGECYSVRQLIKQFGRQKYLPDLILDAGKLPKKKVTTIIKVKNDRVEILRQGGIKITQKSKL